MQDVKRETYNVSSLIKQLDVYVVIEYTMAIFLTSETYCIKHFVCLFDIEFSSAEKAPAKRIRNALSRDKATIWTEKNTRYQGLGKA